MLYAVNPSFLFFSWIGGNVAALLVQGSVQVYSRKVEYLYSLVLHALEFISNQGYAPLSYWLSLSHSARLDASYFLLHKGISWLQ